MKMRINPLLNFKGNTEEAFNFYKSVFGGDFSRLMRYDELPGSEKLPEADRKKIMHIALPIGNGSVLMAADVIEAMGNQLFAGNNFYLHIEAESRKEADRFYTALSAEGSATMPMMDAFWGSYFGILTDKFGIQWMVGFDPNENK